MNGCNSRTDGIVRMIEKKYVSLLRLFAPYIIIRGNFFRSLNMHNSQIKKLTVSAMLTALGVILIYFNFSIFPQAPHLKYDAGDIPILIITFIYGPVYGIISTLIVSIYQALFLSADGWFGGLMHVLATCALLIPAGVAYKIKKTKISAAVGLLIGCVSMVVVMMFFNYFFIPLFYGMPREAVVAIMPWTVLFNAIKAILNSFVTFLIYKHINTLIKKF